MSEKNTNGTERALGPLIATALVGVAAIAAVIFLIVMNAGGNNGSDSSGGLSSNAVITFRPTEELVDECNNNAHDLVANNYEVLRLFLLEGVPHEDEPYGNEPEDGYYTAKSSRFPTMESMETFVKSTFVADEAERILRDFDGNGRAVYVAREGYDGALGVKADFQPDTSYNKPWESSRIQFVPVSETECSLKVFLGADEETDLSTVSEDHILETTMIKGEDGWRLTELVY